MGKKIYFMTFGTHLVYVETIEGIVGKAKETTKSSPLGHLVLTSTIIKLVLH
jgi:hypothetical protein